MSTTTVAQFFSEHVSRVPSPAPGWWAAVAAACALVALAAPAVWRRARLLVTLVHESGHAAAGILVGRRFTGFVVNGDMSGHAVTRGRPSGPGLALTTWAGYPAPAVLGAVMLWAGLGGWWRPLSWAGAVVLLLLLFFCRSWRTAGVVLVALAASAALGWFGTAQVGAAVSCALGLFLLLGAWRHVWAVMRGGDRGDDPGALARQTRVPAWLWNGSYLLVLVVLTALVAWFLQRTWWPLS